MENANSEIVTNKTYTFLDEKKAKEVFSRVDYFLRSGVHIQREYPKPEELFRFIDKDQNYQSLKTYYSDFFQLTLAKGGEQLSRYYYLDFEDETNRSKIPSDYRFKKHLETSYIIIGMLFFKLYRLDANIELDSVNDFIQLLFTEYTEEKNGLFRLIASANSERSTEYIDKDVIKEIRDAFDEFEKLGWIMWIDDSKDKFKYLHSFERLRKKYHPQINTIDEIINKLNGE